MNNIRPLRPIKGYLADPAFREKIKTQGKGLEGDCKAEEVGFGEELIKENAAWRIKDKEGEPPSQKKTPD